MLSLSSYGIQRTDHAGEYVIASVANGLALDATIDDELGRHPVMWTPHAEAHQRWRLHPTEDGSAFVIQSVLTGHVLDVPEGSERHDRPVLWERHGGIIQQFLVVSPAGGLLR